MPLRPWPGPTAGELPTGALVCATTLPCPDTMILRAVGEIDLLTVAGWARLARLACGLLWSPGHAAGITGARPPRLICDLSGVGFLGASGLAALVELEGHAASCDVEFVVVATSRAVLRPLKLTALDRRLALAGRLSDAVARPAGLVAAP